MKKNLIIKLVIIFVFFLVSFRIMANDPKDRPVTVSPGSDQEVSVIGQDCPTFSWSAVDSAASYRVAVFVTDDAKVTPYEEITARTSPLVSKDITGPALSWTLSSEESLKTGNMYAWYVQAVDAYGNAVSGWSKGRIFKVKQEVVWVGIEEKLGQKLKEHGVSEDVIKNVLQDIDSEVKEVIVKTPGSPIPANSNSIGRLKGLEDTYNTFYGVNAGRINTGTNNAFFGANAGYSNDNGTANSFIGDNAGFSNISGSGNAFLGPFSGYDNQNGSYNVFIGNGSGQHNISGNDNVFIGNSTGLNNTGNQNCFMGSFTGDHNTGNLNTFLGYNTGYVNTAPGGTFVGAIAGLNNTSGEYNSFIGYQSGKMNNTGRLNTFIGSYSGDANTFGYNNTFVGYGSGGSNIHGDNNAFLGFNAGTSNTTGDCNTYLGDATGYKNTTGCLNAALGYYAGYENSLGYYNTYIGAYAGRYSTGTGNVFLGSFAGYNEVGHNKLYIENSQTATPLIYGDFASDIVLINGSLGIGVSPSYPLNMASGAHCTAGGVWTNASSRSLKENIREITTVEALEALNQLNPVRYN
ncbi:MAG TPA: hypothetical protein VK186_27375, partial [Candidatus Deferrimicrobium sp.]|nr:hypothetical protein [Candidatus Deferrimicrobium sp.]